MLGARPFEDLRQQACDQFLLPALLGVGAAALIVGLVPDIPRQNTLVFRKGADDTCDATLQHSVTGGVREAFAAGSLNPAGIVDPGDGRMLRSERRIGIPARIEQHEHRLDSVPGRDLQKRVEAPRETLWILL